MYRAAKLESLLEFLVLKKHARVSLLKKDQADFFNLLVRGQKILDRHGRNFRRLDFGIAKSSCRNRWKRNGGDGMLASE